MLKEQQEKKNDLITRAEEIVKAAESEKRELTEDEAAEIAEIRDDVRKIKEQIGLVKDVKELATDKAPAKVEVEEDGDKEIEVKETRAFEQYLRNTVLNERDDNTPLSKGVNGDIIPTTIAKRIIEKVYAISPILERSTRYDVKGNIALPKYEEDETDFINVAFQGAEFTKLSANSGKFGSVNLGGYVAGALALVSRSLANNVDFDIVGFVVDRMAYSIKRFLEKNLLNGSGAISGQSGTVEGLTGVTKTTTAASQTAIVADELIDLQDSILDDFQANAIWIMNTKTRTAVRKLKDEMGRYLLQDDISSPFGKTLLGKPVYVSDNMPEMAAGKTAIYYGDMRGLATKFTKNMEIQVLREKYADQNADGVIGWFEFDSKVEDTQKIAKLVMAA